jgi:hypothetical protein
MTKDAIQRAYLLKRLARMTAQCSTEGDYAAGYRDALTTLRQWVLGTKTRVNKRAGGLGRK